MSPKTAAGVRDQENSRFFVKQWRMEGTMIDRRQQRCVVAHEFAVIQDPITHQVSCQACVECCEGWQMKDYKDV